MKANPSRSLWLVIASATIVLAIGRLPALALPTCPSTITNCCAIVSSGSYTAPNPITASASSGACIDIESSNVQLSTANITGPGTKSSVGIRIDAPGAVVAAFVSNFGTGILVNAPRTILVADVVQSSIGDGISANASQLIIQGSLVENNGGRGLVDNAPNGVTIQGSFFTGNGGNGAEFDGPTFGVGLICGRPATIPSAILGSANGGVTVSETGANSNGGNGFAFSGVSGVTFPFNSAAIGTPASSNKLDGLKITNSSGISVAGVAADGNQGNGIELSTVVGATLSNFTVSDNSLDGVKLTQVQGTTTNDADSSDNGVEGYEVRASCQSALTQLTAETNGASGIFIGCQDGLGRCIIPGSGNTLDFNGTPNGVLDPLTANALYGIEVEKGEGGDQFYGNDASGNIVGDAIDHNANCGTDLWWANLFTNGTPPCVNNDVVP